jgi:hypothetical protein
MLLRGWRMLGSFVLSESNSNAQLNTYRTDATDFDFPLMLRYRFLSGPRRPFVKAGYVVTHESYDDFASSAAILSGTGSATETLPGQPASGTLHLSQVLQGGAAGIGEEFKYRKIHIAPEVRFTYLSYGSGSPQKEMSVLVSFLFQ